jgi:hypothetical protein
MIVKDKKRGDFRRICHEMQAPNPLKGISWKVYDLVLLKKKIISCQAENS